MTGPLMTLTVSRLLPAVVALVVAVPTGRGDAGQDTGDGQAAPRRVEMAALWQAPPPGRDLYFGVGGRRLAPKATDLYTVIAIKATGFSDGYTVRDPGAHEWSVKFPPEAGPEITASRLFWGIGYHQPPEYLLADWRAERAESGGRQRPARFREKKPDFHHLDDHGSWSYYDNPFMGTHELKGLLVLQAMLGNSDLKDENNALYRLDGPVEGSATWYVARDLGQTFGRTGYIDPPRGDIDVFEATPFIRGVVDGRVTLEYTGRHQDLFADITVADVEWICRRLNELSLRQWRDAFRAGGFDRITSERFIRRMKQKIGEGLNLASKERRSS